MTFSFLEPDAPDPLSDPDLENLPTETVEPFLFLEEEHAEEPTGRPSKDEMNLVGFPFALLSDRAPKDLKVITFSDTIQGKNGKPMERRWTVRGAEGLGLPLAFEEALYVVLMELTLEQGFRDSTVHFTRYDLVRRLGLPDKGDSYRRLKEGLLRLQGSQITAENAFWDPEAGRYASVIFSLVDEVVLYDENPGRKAAGEARQIQSWFRWSETIWKNMQAGHIKNLDVEFYLSLSSNVSRRLYRYLDKMRFSDLEKDRTRRIFSISLDLLAFERLGLSRSYYPSQIKRQLQAPHEELLEKGFIITVVFAQKKTGPGEKIVYEFPKTPLRGERKPRPIAAPGTGEARREGEKRRKERPGPPPKDPSADSLFQTLLDQGVGKIIARRLVNEKRDEVERQLAYLPYADVRTTPGAYLRKAIEEGWGPPKRYEESKRRESKRREQAQKNEALAEEALQREQAERIHEEHISRMKAELSPEALEALEAEALRNVLARNRAMARLAEQGKGGKGLNDLVKAEAERLLHARSSGETETELTVLDE